MSDTTADFKPVETRASLLLQQKQKALPFQALVFQEPQITAHSNNDTTSDNKDRDKRSSGATNDEEFDIKRARHEVIRFATQNQRVTKNKKKLQIMQAVKLGAKPPRKKYKNYKVLVEERKRLKTIRDERQKFHQLGKNQTGAASVKCRSKAKLEQSKKKRAPVTDIDQSYGVVKSKGKRKK